MDRNEPFDLVAALQTQVAANKERLRRTRKMVAVITEHLDHNEGIAHEGRLPPQT